MDERDQRDGAGNDGEREPHILVYLQVDIRIRRNEALRAVVDPGDEVIYLSARWFFYLPMILSLGAKPIRVDLAPRAFALPVDAREQSGPRTRAIILNTPHNPSGTITQPQELQRLAATFYVLVRSPMADDVAFTERLAKENVFVMPGNVLSCQVGSASHSRPMTTWASGRSPASRGPARQVRRPAGPSPPRSAGRTPDSAVRSGVHKHLGQRSVAWQRIEFHESDGTLAAVT